MDLPKSAVTHTSEPEGSDVWRAGRTFFFFFERVCVLQRDGGDLSDFLQEENGHDNGDNVRVRVRVCSRCT